MRQRAMTSMPLMAPTLVPAPVIRKAIPAPGAMDPAAAEEEIAWAHAFKETMRPWAVDKAPANFINADEGQIRLRAANGDPQCERLVAVMDIYDPANVFALNPSIVPTAGPALPPQPRSTSRGAATSGDKPHGQSQGHSGPSDDSPQPPGSGWVPGVVSESASQVADWARVFPWRECSGVAPLPPT